MRSHRVGLFAASLVTVAAMSGCAPSLQQSSASDAAQSVIRLIADEQYDEACAGTMVGDNESSYRPVSTEPDLLESCLEQLPRIHQFWTENDMLDAASTITVDETVSLDTYGGQVLTAPGLDEGGGDVSIPFSNFDGKWFVHLYYFPSVPMSDA